MEKDVRHTCVSMIVAGTLGKGREFAENFGLLWPSTRAVQGSLREQIGSQKYQYRFERSENRTLGPMVRAWQADYQWGI